MGSGRRVLSLVSCVPSAGWEPASRGDHRLRWLPCSRRASSTVVPVCARTCARLETCPARPRRAPPPFRWWSVPVRTARCTTDVRIAEARSGVFGGAHAAVDVAVAVECCGGGKPRRPVSAVPLCCRSQPRSTSESSGRNRRHLSVKCALATRLSAGAVLGVMQPSATICSPHFPPGSSTESLSFHPTRPSHVAVAAEWLHLRRGPHPPLEHRFAIVMDRAAVPFLPGRLSRRGTAPRPAISFAGIPLAAAPAQTVVEPDEVPITRSAAAAGREPSLGQACDRPDLPRLAFPAAPRHDNRATL